ncbi:hypothetical protein PoB_005892400 [Plakobranchus ocellatus]|uniref:Uncharacterized protein n=1 Tax=Plakobranchus ocellatus TaxID=259542 RepID=A0AAV4CI34_9GAST|nr:hypothetical protein PoB_005892400 [Plakobranchus ocellatus]
MCLICVDRNNTLFPRLRGVGGTVASESALRSAGTHIEHPSKPTVARIRTKPSKLATLSQRQGNTCHAAASVTVIASRAVKVPSPQIGVSTVAIKLILKGHNEIANPSSCLQRFFCNRFDHHC